RHPRRHPRRRPARDRGAPLEHFRARAVSASFLCLAGGGRHDLRRRPAGLRPRTGSPAAAGDWRHQDIAEPEEELMAAKKPIADQELIRGLAELLDETGLTEIEIEREGIRVRVARGGGMVFAAPQTQATPATP